MSEINRARGRRGGQKVLIKEGGIIFREDSVPIGQGSRCSRATRSSDVRWGASLDDRERWLNDREGGRELVKALSGKMECEEGEAKRDKIGGSE
jgi:hypothetical protein